MHARRPSNPRVSLPSSPLHHHIPTTTSSSSPHRRASISGTPYKLAATFPFTRSRSHRSRRPLALGLGALCLLMMCMVLYNLLGRGEELVEVQPGRDGGAGRVVPAHELHEELQRPAGVQKLQKEEEERQKMHKWEMVNAEPVQQDSVGDGEEDPAREDSQQAQEDGEGAEVVEEHVVVPNSKNLPPCKRTMLFKMAGLHGFGSEFNLLIRAASLARQYDYTLLPIDSSSWNYGDISAFFHPLPLTCRPPKESIRRASMTFEDAEVDGEPGPSGVNLRWTKANHVVWGHRDLPGLDRAVVGLFTREEEVGELHRWDLEKLSLEHRRKEAKEGRKEVLEASETVPEAYREVFGVQSGLAKELWRPNEEMERMVEHLVEELGLVEGAQAPKQAGDVVIGVHVRLGDKYMEASHIGPQAYAKDLVPEPVITTAPGLHAALLESYLESAVSLVDSILATSAGAWQGKPTLVVMSDDGDAWKAFGQHKLGRSFRVVGTPIAVVDNEEREVKRDEGAEKVKGQGKKMVKEVKKLGKRAAEGEDPLKKDGGFNEISFNAMALSSRVSLTKTFVRDVSLLAKHADGLVLTASSNVGRLLMLLAGPEKANALEGRVKSLDTRWFPTSQFY